VARVFRTKGYGYIQTADGQVYFRQDALEGVSLDEIRKGTPVNFELIKGRDGPQAARVFAAGNGR
jgi:cold shock CspA family protein